MIDERIIKEKVSKIHEGDIQQLKVIFSESNRIIVEAPAGYGKTTTMVSRIAYLYAIGKIPNPKKMLGLTFSVNAALKVKRDVSAKLPEILGGKDNPVSISESICVTNYHGFCKGILKKYGHLLNLLLRKDLNLFKAIGDYELSNNTEIQSLLLNEEISYLLRMEDNIKKSVVPSIEEIKKYNNIVFDKLLAKDIVTHTGIILMTLQIFEGYETIRSFYSSYYEKSAIIVSVCMSAILKDSLNLINDTLGYDEAMIASGAGYEPGVYLSSDILKYKYQLFQTPKETPFRVSLKVYLLKFT